jgi:hypothetical protein
MWVPATEHTIYNKRTIESAARAGTGLIGRLLTITTALSGESRVTTILCVRGNYWRRHCIFTAILRVHLGMPV